MCILLVEDEFLIREIAREALEETGREVIATEHGLEAFEYLEGQPGRFVCLVTDYHLPGGVHGGHVIERMRALYPAIPMILASAYPTVTTFIWRSHYNVKLLIKPYFPEELFELVEEILY